MKRAHFSRPVLVMLILWAATMIIQPIVLWAWGQAALQRGLSLTVLVQAAAVLVILGEAWSLKRTAAVLVLVAVSSFLAEWAGSQTGLPFGRYHYTDVLQPQLAGVPLLIPAAWLMMLPPAWAVAHRLSGKSGRHYAFVLLSGLAFTAWDLFLDPQMVGWNFWVWDIPGVYFGIPLINFLGWLLVSALITWLVNPAELPTAPLMSVYVITWLLQTVGQGLFWAQPGPALAGFLAMGALVFLACKPAVSGKQRSLRNAR